MTLSGPCLIRFQADGVASPSMASTLIETAVLEHGSVPVDRDELFRDATGMAYFGEILNSYKRHAISIVELNGCMVKQGV